MNGVPDPVTYDGHGSLLVDARLMEVDELYPMIWRGTRAGVVVKRANGSVDFYAEYPSVGQALKLLWRAIGETVRRWWQGQEAR